MTNELRCWCRHCKAELPPDHTGPCPRCGKHGKDCKATATVAVNVAARVSSRARHKGKGSKKFVKEILQGWFSSINPALKEGVHKERIVDREKNEYHETVEDARTGDVIRDIHEPLTQHKSARQPTKKRNRSKEARDGKQGKKECEKAQAEKGEGKEVK